MPVNLIHVSDIHLGSGEGHGKINPESGLNVRFEDFCLAWEKVVDYSIKNKVDAFLFSGDAYKNATPEPLQQKMFAKQLKRLSEAAIPTVLLIGNHDQYFKASTSHSLSVFQSLSVPNLTIIDEPKLLTITTASGPLQIIGIPYVTKHFLMTKEKYAHLGPGDLDNVLVSLVNTLLQNFYSQLDQSIPTVATAHMMVDRARAGSEEQLLVGYTMTFPLEIFINPCLDYVALGHVHKHQILHKEKPVIAYAGSLERVDFSEETEDKGFIQAKISRGKVELEFHSIQPRKFLTCQADLVNSQDPTGELCQLIKSKAEDGLVMRVCYRLSQENLAQLNENQVRNTAPQLLSLKLCPEIITNKRLARLPDISEQASPEVALEKYLAEFCPDNKEELMQRTRQLMSKLQRQED